MKLAIVIVNFNTPQDTIECLLSIKNAAIPADLQLETTVVDNGSSDDSVEILRSRFPEIKLIQSDRNLGFAGGHNLGTRAALTENPSHVFWLNPDTLLDKHFFTQLKRSAINQKNVGLLTPLIYFAKGFEFHKDRYAPAQLGHVVWSAGGKFDWDNVIGANNHVDEVDTGQFNQVEDTDFASGAALIMKKEVIDQIGLLNEDYFLYLEDVEFCHRARLADWRIVFDPGPKLWHKVSRSSGIGSPLNDYFITRNRFIFGLKYARPRTKFALLREAVRKLFTGTPAQKTAVNDFFLHRWGKGSWLQ